jgi:hypothetical protein
MFMSFDRSQSHSRPTSQPSVPDATGSPFTPRGGDSGRPNGADLRDYRDQADGAP